MAISIDFQGTYGVTEQKETQDLGVMGTLDNAQRPESMIPSEGDAELNTRAQQAQTGTETVEETPVETVDPTIDAASGEEPQSQPIDEDQGSDQ